MNTGVLSFVYVYSFILELELLRTKRCSGQVICVISLIGRKGPSCHVYDDQFWISYTSPLNSFSTFTILCCQKTVAKSETESFWKHSEVLLQCWACKQDWSSDSKSWLVLAVWNMIFFYNPWFHSSQSLSKVFQNQQLQHPRVSL